MAKAAADTFPTMVRSGKELNELSIGFASPTEASQFLTALNKVAESTSVTSSPSLELNGSTVLVKASRDRGFGAYVSGGGEPAINFINDSIRQAFIKLLNMVVNTRVSNFSEKGAAEAFAISPKGVAKAIYFNPRFVTAVAQLIRQVPSPSVPGGSSIPGGPATSADSLSGGAAIPGTGSDPEQSGSNKPGM